MKENRKKLSPIARFLRNCVIVIALMSCSMQALAASTSARYINFPDGTVHVFPDSCVKRIATTASRITITAKDGVAYTYLTADITSMTTELIKELPTITSFKFDDKYNYQLISDAQGIISGDTITASVAGIGKRLTATFELSSGQARLLADDKVLLSQASRLRYDGCRYLVAAQEGDLVLSRMSDGTYSLKPYGKKYAVNVTFLTDLARSVPQIRINTVGCENITSKEFYLDAEIIIDGRGVFPSMTDSVKIKGRGNSSWSSNPDAKNPYRLKFSSKVKPLGLTKGKNWVLIANKNKGSMLTNAYGMKAASLIGTAAVNHIIPVDLYVNGIYKGSYNFTEKVGLSNNSVDIDTEEVAALLELDTYFDEADGQKFESGPYAMPVNIKDPEFDEGETLLTMEDIESRFNQFLSAVEIRGNLADHVDIDYLARYLMATELICNKELFYPKSVYCYNENILDSGSKFIFGPMWDLDWGFGYTGDKYTYFSNDVTRDFFASTAYMPQNEFFSALRHNPQVVARLHVLWQDFMENSLDELCEYCLDYFQYAQPSIEKNNEVLGDPINYATQAELAANWLRTRANYLYNAIQHERLIPGDIDNDGKITISDATTFIDYLLGQIDKVAAPQNLDCNSDGWVNISDLTTIIDHMLHF